MRGFLKNLFAKRQSKSRAGAEPIDDLFEPGQVWSYRARSGEESSRVIIGRVERMKRFKPDGEADDCLVVSIVISGLSISGNSPEDGRLEQISHIPLDRNALAKSLVQLESSNARVPDGFDEGYREWRRVFDLGQAGVYTASLQTIVQLAESTFRSKAKPRR